MVAPHKDLVLKVLLSKPLHKVCIWKDICRKENNKIDSNKKIVKTG